MSTTETREEWLAHKVAKAREDIKAGRVYTSEEANRRMDEHIAAVEARLKGKAA